MWIDKKLKINKKLPTQLLLGNASKEYLDKDFSHLATDDFIGWVSNLVVVPFLLRIVISYSVIGEPNLYWGFYFTTICQIYFDRITEHSRTTSTKLYIFCKFATFQKDWTESKSFSLKAFYILVNKVTLYLCLDSTAEFLWWIGHQYVLKI